MTLIRLEDLPAETSDFTDILQKLTLDFKSRQISEAILKALKPNCISILHTETMLNYVLFTATPDMQQEASHIVGGFLEDLLGKDLKPWQRDRPEGGARHG